MRARVVLLPRCRDAGLGHLTGLCLLQTIRMQNSRPISVGLRHTTRRMGYGASAPEEADPDELNDDLLDNVHLAGARFDRMLWRLAG